MQLVPEHEGEIAEAGVTEDPAKMAGRFRNLCLVCLCAAAGFVLAGQYVIALQADARAESGRFLELAGKQGPLLQSIALESRELADLATPDRPKMAEQLFQSLSEWKQAHHTLLNGGDQVRLPAASASVREALAREEADALAVIEAGAQIQSEWRDLGRPAFADLLARIAQHSSAVEEGSNSVAQGYQAQKEGELGRSQKSEEALIAFTLLLLAGQGFFLIRPASKKLQSLIHDLSYAHREIGGQNARLARNSHDLEVRRRELELANESLERMNHDLELVSEQHRVAARRFQDLFRDIPIACYTFDRNGTVFEWNAAAGALWGRGSWETFQVNCFETLYTEEEGNFLRILSNRVFEGGSVQGLETRALTLDGEQRIVISHMIPLLNSAGEVTGALNASIDITEQRVPSNAFKEPAASPKASRKKAA